MFRCNVKQWRFATLSFVSRPTIAFNKTLFSTSSSTRLWRWNETHLKGNETKADWMKSIMMESVCMRRFVIKYSAIIITNGRWSTDLSSTRYFQPVSSVKYIPTMVRCYNMRKRYMNWFITERSRPFIYDRIRGKKRQIFWLGDV